jgi:hypothetical protein
MKGTHQVLAYAHHVNLLGDFFIIPVYLQSVQVYSANWLKEVGECLVEGRSLALFYS